MSKHFGFTGTQEELTPKQKLYLRYLLVSYWDEGFRIMHNGDCVGADIFAAETWRDLDGQVHGHPPADPKKRAWFQFDMIEPELPYLVRNRNIVNHSEELIACSKLPHAVLHSGTWSTVRFAYRQNKPVDIVWPDGRLMRYETYDEIPIR